MAEETKKKKEEAPAKVVLERVYTVPLRKEWLKVPKYKRAKKAVNGLREFMEKHMKSEDIRISNHINLNIWKHGIKNPPHKVTVKATKDEKGVVTVVPDVEVKERVPRILQKARGKAAELDKKKKDDKKETSADKAKEEKAETAKTVEKEELKDIKKENPQHKAPAEEPKQQNPVDQKPNAPKQAQ